MLLHPNELGPIHQYPGLVYELPIIGAAPVVDVPDPELYSLMNVIPLHLI